MDARGEARFDDFGDVALGKEVVGDAGRKLKVRPVTTLSRRTLRRSAWHGDLYHVI